VTCCPPYNCQEQQFLAARPKAGISDPAAASNSRRAILPPRMATSIKLSMPEAGSRGGLCSWSFRCPVPPTKMTVFSIGLFGIVCAEDADI
jgi:hypothetical protein